jgi:cobalt-zinc-cadmium efflux system outer membrane protein
MVGARVSGTVAWNRTAAEDASAAAAVRRLLERPLTAESAVHIALLNNRDLQAAYEELGVSYSDFVQAGLLENPVFSAEVLFDGGTSATLGVTQNLINVLTLPGRRSIAASNFGRAQLTLSQKILDLAANVRGAYYKLVADEQAVELFRQIVTATEAAADLAERQVQAGNLSRRDQALHQVLYAQMSLELARAEAQLQTDRETINRLLGLWGTGVGWSTPERLPEVQEVRIPLEELEPLAVAQRLDLAAARKAVESARSALELARWTRLLRVVGVGVEVEREPHERWSAGPTLRLGLPLFDQGQAQIAALEGTLQERERKLEFLAIETRSQIRATWARLMATQESALHYRVALLPLHEQIVAENQRLYNGMLIGVYDLLRSKHDQIVAARDYVGALRDYWIARSELERAVGGPLPMGQPKPLTSGTEPRSLDRAAQTAGH